MDPETRAALEGVRAFKRKAPRLKTGDRTISLALDSYVPPPPSGTSQLQPLLVDTGHIHSGITMDPNLLIDNNLIIPPPQLPHITSSPIQELKQPNTFYMNTGTLDNYSTDLTHPHTHQMSRKPNMRRYDTLDVFSIGAYEMRKANSFNANDPQVVATADDNTMSRRTSSMRHGSTSVFPYEMVDDVDANSMATTTMHHAADVTPSASTSSSRRNCRMHKSFHERSRQHDINKIEKVIDAKCHSVGDDGSDDNLNAANARRLSPKFNSAQSSLENEVFHMHSRSSSRNRIEAGAESIDMIEATSPLSAPGADAAAATTAAKKSHATGSHKHSSQSLDKPHRSFRRIARATQSFYVAPSIGGDQRMAYAMHGPNAAIQKRMHSVSMRTKPFRDGMGDGFHGDMSPQRHDSISDVKKSPRLSSSGYEFQKPAHFDGDGFDQDAVMRGYRHNRRKSSLLSTGTSGTMKKNLKKKASDDMDMDNEKAMDGDNSGSARKRKQIVCIAVSLVLSLVFASIFIVIFTMSYSSITQASDHTKRVYSFAPGPGNRELPIHHHNVRQENERLQENLRGKYMRNLTNTAPLVGNAGAQFIAGQQQQLQPHQQHHQQQQQPYYLHQVNP